MPHGNKRAVRADHDVIADGYRRLRQDRRAKVDEYGFSDGHIAAILHVEWRVQPGNLGLGRQQFPQNLLRALWVSVVQLIELLDQQEATAMFGADLLVDTGHEPLPAGHALKGSVIRQVLL